MLVENRIDRSIRVVETVYAGNSPVYLEKRPQDRAGNIAKLEKGEKVVFSEEKGFGRKVRVRGIRRRSCFRVAWVVSEKGRYH